MDAVDADRELDESLAQMEVQIFHDEGSYIKETPCGNVIRGFESFHDRCVCALLCAMLCYYGEQLSYPTSIWVFLGSGHVSTSGNEFPSRADGWSCCPAVLRPRVR